MAQSISGRVLDTSNKPVPNAHLYIQETESGVTTDETGGYFITIDPGIYTLIVTSVGYDPRTVQVVVGDRPTRMIIHLETSTTELEEIVVKASRRDPAYEIIQFAINNKDRYLKQVNSSRSEVYVRAIEIEDRTDKKSITLQENVDVVEERSLPEVSPEEGDKSIDVKRASLLEMQLTLNYHYPDKYKEERTGYKAYGSKEGLFVPVFSESDFNFYNALVSFKGITDVPIISPLSRTSILSYKFKLEEVIKENETVIYKIKVTPRKVGGATCKGYVFINDSTWNLSKVELSLHKTGMIFHDEFTIRQDYEEVNNGIWIPRRQEFVYETKAKSRIKLKGNTTIIYNQYEGNYIFPEKFFGNEVAVTTQEAYDRDSSYWNTIRPEVLSNEQEQVVHYYDSIEVAHKDKGYLDSLEAQYNKVTFGEVLYHGIGFRNDERKSNLHIPSLLDLVNFEVIGGFRLGPYTSYGRRFENGKIVWSRAYMSMGFKNRDLQGSGSVWFRYDPFRLGDLRVSGGRSFQMVNEFDAYLNLLKISNFILHDYGQVDNRIELFNGFYLETGLGYHNRHSVEGYDATTIINEIIEEDEPLVFENYQALVSKVQLSYTPGQRYMREPNRKVVLGSNYPTFQVTHQKGWNGILGSDIDFDYLAFMIKQNISLGTLGNSNYTLQVGKFVNARDLRYVDVRRFRQSDPILYSNPLHSFQLLDTSLFARDLYFEAHYIHHFNGAMINNIPLVKKLRLRTVAGAGMLWVKESNYRHEEVFAGIERIFKVGKRRRLRIGVYGVFGNSNHTPFTSDYKISFDIIDTWKRSWSF